MPPLVGGDYERVSAQPRRQHSISYSGPLPSSSNHVAARAVPDVIVETFPDLAESSHNTQVPAREATESGKDPTILMRQQQKRPDTLIPEQIIFTFWFETRGTVSVSHPPDFVRDELMIGDLFYHRNTASPKMSQLWVWIDDSRIGPYWKPVKVGYRREDGRRLLLSEKRKNPSWLLICVQAVSSSVVLWSINIDSYDEDNASQWESDYSDALTELAQLNSCNAALFKAVLALQKTQKSIDTRLAGLETEIAAIRGDMESSLRLVRVSYRHAQANLKTERNSMEEHRIQTVDDIAELRRKYNSLEIEMYKLRGQLGGAKTELGDVNSVLLSIQTWAQKTDGIIEQLEEDGTRLIKLLRDTLDQTPESTEPLCLPHPLDVLAIESASPAPSSSISLSLDVTSSPDLSSGSGSLGCSLAQELVTSLGGPSNSLAASVEEEVAVGVLQTFAQETAPSPTRQHSPSLIIEDSRPSTAHASVQAPKQLPKLAAIDEVSGSSAAQPTTRPWTAYNDATCALVSVTATHPAIQDVAKPRERPPAVKRLSPWTSDHSSTADFVSTVGLVVLAHFLIHGVRSQLVYRRSAPSSQEQHSVTHWPGELSATALAFSAFGTCCILECLWNVWREQYEMDLHVFDRPLWKAAMSDC
ncbi:hypothetical protein C8Q76DRAFT_798724 [Earliella scabrosa]|nr:hypothetical protein C8Q76DRAFT_798724 [Earliella scabrosa]